MSERSENRNKHGVVEVCMRLHAADRGSGDGIPDDERRTLIEWLKWRTSMGWVRGLFDVVDFSIHQLAVAVLEQSKTIDAMRGVDRKRSTLEGLVEG